MIEKKRDEKNVRPPKSALAPAAVRAGLAAFLQD